MLYGGERGGESNRKGSMKPGEGGKSKYCAIEGGRRKKKRKDETLCNIDIDNAKKVKQKREGNQSNLQFTNVKHFHKMRDNNHY